LQADKLALVGKSIL